MGADVRSAIVTPTSAELAAWRTVAAAVDVLDRAGVPEAAVRLMGGVMAALHIRLSGLDLAVRATKDADLGMPLQLVTEHRVEEALTDAFGKRLSSNRWAGGAEDDFVLDLLVHSAAVPVPKASDRHRWTHPAPATDVWVGGRQWFMPHGMTVALRCDVVRVNVEAGPVQDRGPPARHCRGHSAQGCGGRPGGPRQRLRGPPSAAHDRGPSGCDCSAAG